VFTATPLALTDTGATVMGKVKRTVQLARSRLDHRVGHRRPVAEQPGLDHVLAGRQVVERVLTEVVGEDARDETSAVEHDDLRGRKR
jgi:hypothetical protein